MRKLVEIAGFQVTWLALVWGAANGRIWFGLAAAVIFLTAHLVAHRDGAASQLIFLTEAAAFGFLVDSLLVLAGAISFPPKSQLGWPATIWMAALWACFAAALSGPLRWLADSPRMAIAFGLAGGPLAYYIGSRMGALVLGPAGPIVLVLIAGEWALAMPVLVLLLRLRRLQTAPAPRTSGACP